MFIDPTTSKELQTPLFLEEIPKMRLYHNDIKLFSEFSLNFKYLQGKNGLFEISDFLRRKLHSSFTNLKKQVKLAERILSRAALFGKPHFLMVLERHLPFCEDNDVFETNRDNLLQMKNLFLTLSRVMSPVPSLYVTDTQDLLNFDLHFDGLLFSQDSGKANNIRNISWRNQEVQDSSEQPSKSLCNGLFVFNGVQAAYSFVSLQAFFNKQISFTETILKIKSQFELIKEQFFPLFRPGNIEQIWNRLDQDQTHLRGSNNSNSAKSQILDYHPGKYFFINEPFMNNFLSPATKDAILMSIANPPQKIKNHPLFYNSRVFFLDHTDPYVKTQYEQLLGYDYSDYYMFFIDSSKAQSKHQIRKFRYLKSLTSGSQEINGNQMSLDLNISGLLSLIDSGAVSQFKLSKDFQYLPDSSTSALSTCDHHLSCLDSEICPGNNLVQHQGVFELTSQMFQESVIASPKTSVLYLFDSCLSLAEIKLFSDIKSQRPLANVFFMDITHNELEDIDFETQFGARKVLIFLAGKKTPVVVNLVKFLRKTRDQEFRAIVANKLVNMVDNLEAKRVNAEDI